MKRSLEAPRLDMAQLDEDTGKMTAADAEAYGEKLDQVQRRLAVVVERARELAGRVRDQASNGAKVVDKTVHQHPYRAIGIAFGLSAIVGFCLMRARACSEKK